MLTAPASTVTLTIYRDPSAIQDVDLVEGDPLPVETAVERPLDKLTMIVQRVKEVIGRSLRLPEGDTGFVDADMYLPAEVDRASKYLGFDADGKPIATAGTTDATPISSFMATVVDDADAAAARATLVAAGTGATGRSDLGLGTAAVKNTGTSGDAVPICNASNTFGKAQGSAQVALSDAANIATDASLGNVFAVTLGDNRTLDNPTNLVSGFTYIWNINQDGTGSRTLAYGSVFKFPGGSTPVLSTAASSKDSLSCVYDGTDLRCVISKGFA
jgi:hypothetical protein